MFKVIAVLINVHTPVCGPETGVQCAATFDQAIVSSKSFRTIDECLKYSVRARTVSVEKGTYYNTFCAEVR